MTQQRTQNAERIREVRLQLQSLVEDLYWGDIDGAKIDDFQRNQARQVYLLLKGVEYDLLHEQPVVEVEEQSEYDKIHEQYPDAVCLFRCGDFYEVYREDAQKVCKVLNITLTHRNHIDGTPVPMAGFPFHSLDTYLPKLVRAGLRVAICDEMKSGKKGVVETHKK